MSSVVPHLDPATCVKVAPYDDQNWIVQEDFHYVTTSVRPGMEIIVPAGFVSDGASIPRFFWRRLPPFGLHFNAAIVHDWLYRHRPHLLTRSEADIVLLEIMQRDRVPEGRQRAMLYAVRWFGRRSYKGGKNAALVEVPNDGPAASNFCEIPIELHPDFQKMLEIYGDIPSDSQATLADASAPIGDSQEVAL